jgi:arylsulfatase A-like enzyme
MIALAALTACGEGQLEQCDVIVIVMDTTRVDHLGVYGASRRISPRVDAFARDAEVYRNAWSPSPWTLPAHASLLTGRYPTVHGAHMRPDRDADSLGDNPARLAEEFTTLAELLSDQGYRTAAFAGAGWLAPEFGLLQGYALQDAENQRDIPAREITDRASAWIDGVPEGEAIHLLVNYFDPHFPYQPPEGFDVFPEAGRDLQWPLSPGEMGMLSREEIRQRLKPLRARIIDRYDGEILYMDHHIGRLLDKLRSVGRYDDALIVIVADHGEAFGENGAVGHGTWLYESLIRIPFLVHRPGGRNAGVDIEHPVSLVDVLTIVADEVGLELPADIDGVPVGERTLVLAEESPIPLVRQPSGASRLDRDVVAGIRWPLKLIINIPGPVELYRLDLDPEEKEELRSSPGGVELERQVVEAFAALRPAAVDGEVIPMSPQSRERLKALGYLE